MCSLRFLKKVSILLEWLPNPNHVALFAGKQKGFFEEQGIDLKIHKAPSTDPLQMLTTKQTDLIVYYLPRTLLAVSLGAPFCVIGKLIQEPLDCILVLSNSPFFELKDLKAKKIGIADSSYSTLMLDTFFHNAGPKNHKKSIVNFDLTTALLMGNVDAIYGCYWNVETEQIRSLGKETRYFTTTSFGVPAHEELVIVGIKGSPFTEKDFTDRFQRALNKSMNFAISEQKEAFKLYLSLNPEKEEKTINWEEKAWEKTIPILPRSQDFSKSAIIKLSDWLLEKKIISTKVDPEEIFSLLRKE